MTPFVIGNIQFTFSLVVYACIAVWYVYPALKTRDWHKALVPLLLVHAFRYGPLTLLMPGQVSSDVPNEVAQTIAYGDLVSGVLAILAAIMVWNKVNGAKSPSLAIHNCGLWRCSNCLRKRHWSRSIGYVYGV